MGKVVLPSIPAGKLWVCVGPVTERQSIINIKTKVHGSLRTTTTLMHIAQFYQQDEIIDLTNSENGLRVMYYHQ